MKKISSYLILLFLITCCFLYACKQTNPNPKKFVNGVWWWDNTLDESCLSFALDNDVNEIYFCDQNFENTNLVKSMKDNNLDIYWLIGEKEWLLDFSLVDKTVEQFINHDDAKFYSGIHLDVEPHQFSDFETNRKSYIYSLIDMAHHLKTTYPNIKFDYDIPFWLDDEIEYKGIKKPAYQHMIDISYRVFIMSYRDTAQAMIDVSVEEINYAKQTNKIVILGAETAKSDESNIVSYYEEGKKYMTEQLQIVKSVLPENFGVSIHHIKSWKNLKK